MNNLETHKGNGYIRVRVGLGIAIFGFLLFVLGARPSVFGVDRSPVFGFVQISVMLVGLAVICIGGYISLNLLWRGQEKSIVADIGLRLVSTGYLIAVVAGMADVFGIGVHTFPHIPFFGPLQALGVMFGEFIIVVGLAMLVPYTSVSRKSL